MDLVQIQGEQVVLYLIVEQVMVAVVVLLDLLVGLVAVVVEELLLI